jgi:VanZ family protein
MKRWTILFGLFLVVIIVLADTRHLGALGAVYDFPYGDKVGHFVLFGLLSLVANLSVFEARPNADRKRLAVITSLILALLIGLEEFSQRYFPTRTSDWLDLTASYLGMAFFAWLAVRIKT